MAPIENDRANLREILRMDPTKTRTTCVEDAYQHIQSNLKDRWTEREILEASSNSRRIRRVVCGGEGACSHAGGADAGGREVEESRGVGGIRVVEGELGEAEEGSIPQWPHCEPLEASSNSRRI